MAYEKDLSDLEVDLTTPNGKHVSNAHAQPKKVNSKYAEASRRLSSGIQKVLRNLVLGYFSTLSPFILVKPGPNMI